MRRSLSVALAALTLAAAALPLAAQRQKEQSQLRGWVKDSRGAPIENAEVLVLGTKITTRAGSDGAFRIDSVPAGPYWIGVRRLGFEPNVFSVRLAANDARQFEVVLDALPYGLPAVQVKARSEIGRQRLREFDWRRRTAWGSFYTRDDLERQHGWSLSNLVVRHFPGLTSYELDYPDANAGFDDCAAFGAALYPAGYASRYGPACAGTGFGSAYAFQHCTPALSINGGMLLRGWSFSDFRTDDLEAVEVYRGSSSRLPLELSGQGSACGVVVAWLR